MISRRKRDQERKADKCVVLFHSTSEAIRAESVTKKAGIQVKLRLIPRHLSSDCGICLTFIPSDRAKVEEALSENNVDYDRIKRLE
ncbi:MAG: DUF3343 domain-containing protein [Actinomycetia bacterium]|nr:DUF3343 domain-containing protein [Actinomycetota bacterium]MCG2795540.1 DUF3343 domain-containing protein [Actinomycetes bacterium]